jgi:hypothetical protein
VEGDENIVISVILTRKLFSIGGFVLFEATTSKRERKS